MSRDISNDFSVSPSTAKKLNECLRGHYWAKYAQWGGWNKNLSDSDLCRMAYTLKNAKGLGALVGLIVHAQAAACVNAAAMGAPELNHDLLGAEAIRELHSRVNLARQGLWRKDPKRQPAVLELYYQDPEFEDKLKAAETKLAHCLGALFRNRHFQEIQRRLRDGTAKVIAIEDRSYMTIMVPKTLSHPNETVDDVGFQAKLVPVKVWLTPDLVVQYIPEDRWLVPDYKTGRPEDLDQVQTGVYAWWLRDFHGVESSKMALIRIYLGHYDERVEQGSDSAIMAAENHMRQSVELARRLVIDGDVEENKHLMIAAFEQLERNDRRCGWCNYRRLCGRG